MDEFAIRLLNELGFNSRRVTRLRIELDCSTGVGRLPRVEVEFAADIEGLASVLEEFELNPRRKPTGGVPE